MSDPNFIQGAYTEQEFLEAFNTRGYVIVEKVFTDNFADALVPELHTAIDREVQFHGGSKDFKDYGMLLACPIYGGKFLDVMENDPFLNPFEWVLGDTCITWVYTSSSMPPGAGNHSSRIHVDRPHFIPGFVEGMGSLILLTDFTEENGATWLLPCSHNDPAPPEHDLFYSKARRLLAPKGSVLYFNLRLWHAGGVNHTDKWRHMIGIGMIRPYLKQRIDLPRAMSGVDTSHLSERALQKLGFFAQPPSSLEEYYGRGVESTYRQPSEWEDTNLES